MPRPFDHLVFDQNVFDASDFVPIGATPRLELFTVVPARSPDGEPGDCHELLQSLTTIADECKPLRCTGKVVVQVAGDALDAQGWAERSTNDPEVAPNWAPMGHIMAGNPAGDGLEVMSFVEPTRAWWRFRPVVLTEGVVDVAISGGKD